MAEIPKEELESLMTSMIAASKAVELYPLEHPSVKGPLDKCYKTMVEMLRYQGVLTIGIVDEVLVFEGVPFYNQTAAQEFQNRFEEREINALEIKDGLTSEEFSSFIFMLTEEPENIKDAGGISSAFAERGIEHITAKDAKEIYNSAINAVGDILQETRMGRIPTAGKAKGAVSNLKRMVLSDSPTLLALTLIKSYDNYLFNHSVNVSVLSLSLAHALKIPDDDIGDIGLAGLLHDIGKTITPKSIILKPGKLTPEEWDEMRMHPVKSAEIIEQMDGVSDLVARMVREHHVNFDLNGYPPLEPGEQLHPYSKIITVADCYDAITTLRPYQKPFEPREAMKIMEKLSGKVIDPQYFEEFIKILGIYPIGTLVRLDTNEIGIVIETYADHPLSPKIILAMDPQGEKVSSAMELDLSKPDTYPGEKRSIISTVDPILVNIEAKNYL